MPNRHLLAALSWIGFALWINIPDIMVIISTIFAFCWGFGITAFIYLPTNKLPTGGARQFSALLK